VCLLYSDSSSVRPITTCAALFAFDAGSDLFTNTIDTVKERYITANVARFGDDKTVVIVWQAVFARCV